MSYILFIIKSSLEDFKRNKVRTLLTSLGILIGVSSVVLLMAFGLGLKKYISDQFESLGTNLIIIMPGRLTDEGGNFRNSEGMDTIRFDLRDVNNLKRIKTAEYVVPLFVKTVKVEGEDDVTYSDLYATSADMFAIRNLEAEYGDLWTEQDVTKRSKVIVIGPKLAEKTFGAADEALGKSITIENINYKIVGVLASKGGGGFGGPDFDSFIYMPYTTGYSFNPEKSFFSIYMNAENETVVVDTKDAIKETLLKRYTEDDFSVIEQTEILNAVSSIFGVMNIILVAIAAISLIVGGIGIMNIMYVSVIERIREIGIRRAIGATKTDILMLFLVESVILSLLGGLLGLIIAYIVVFFVQRFFPAYIDLTSVLIALGVSSAIGITFGVFPARKAAALSPIDAIRYE